MFCLTVSVLTSPLTPFQVVLDQHQFQFFPGSLVWFVSVDRVQPDLPISMDVCSGRVVSLAISSVHTLLFAVRHL